MPQPVSVVIPTIGRTTLLRACLESITACRPGPMEVVVVDQSGGPEIAELVCDYRDRNVRTVRSDARGVAAARNAGLSAAAHEIVLMTDDDCTVAPHWVGVGAHHVGSDPRMMVTGRVLPVGDAQAVPSTITDLERRDYTGTVEYFVLYTGNVGFNRSEVLAVGAFDEALPTAEDNDMCYRWLRSGRQLVFEPSLVVWHHDWRSPDELKRVQVSYARGQGAVYAKHLRTGDVRMLYFIGREVYWSLRGSRRGEVAALTSGFVDHLRGRRRPA